MFQVNKKDTRTTSSVNFEVFLLFLVPKWYWYETFTTDLYNTTPLKDSESTFMKVKHYGKNTGIFIFI